jgi:hypothetical protein
MTAQHPSSTKSTTTSYGIDTQKTLRKGVHNQENQRKLGLVMSPHRSGEVQSDDRRNNHREEMMERDEQTLKEGESEGERESR